MIKTYSLKRDKNTQLSLNFKVSEFKCKDGSDEIKIDSQLIELLQNIRDHFGKPVVVNSAYRTNTYNKKKGGAPKSQHLYGTAADIAISGIPPLRVAQYVETLLVNKGGIGVYQSFTHVDVRSSRARWDSRSGKDVSVPGWYC